MMKPGAWRIGAGVAVLLVMLLLATRLVPPYVRNLQFQHALTGVLQRATDSRGSDESVLKGVLEQAALRGLRVVPKDVHVRRAEDWLRVEVLYEVPVALPLYSVDLHFRPRARVP
jgi:hypothetical protein